MSRPLRILLAPLLPSRERVAAIRAVDTPLRLIGRHGECLAALSTGDYHARNRSNVPPPLRNHVGGVFLCGSWKQVGRVAADGIVALVAGLKSIGKFSYRHFQHRPVGVRRLAAIPELAIAVGSYSAQPRPALIGRADEDSGPKTLGRVHALVVIATRLRAVLADLRHEVSHWCAAPCARARDFLRANGATLGVAGMATKAAGLAWPTHKPKSAGYANALNFGSVGARHAR
jgi:hypothetical protein